MITLTQEIAPEIQDFLKALASETRQRILLLFADGRERTVGQVAEEAGVGQSTASEHLSTLRRGGLLQARREQKEVYYSPDGARIRRHLMTLNDLLLRCCPPGR
ncbi:MAG: ArsR/SmtB family transcription factor [Bacillota bacterium]